MRTAGKIFLAIALIAVGAVAMLVITVRAVSKNVHVRETGTEGKKTVDFATPFGKFTVHENDALDPERVGIPVYPGATRTKDKGGADFQIDAGDLHKDFTVTGATYETNDDPSQVQEFYKQKLPAWNRKWENGEVRIEMKDGGQVRSIAIKREDGHTRIGVASVGPPAAN